MQFKVRSIQSRVHLTLNRFYSKDQQYPVQINICNKRWYFFLEDLQDFLQLSLESFMQWLLKVSIKRVTPTVSIYIRGVKTSFLSLKENCLLKEYIQCCRVQRGGGGIKTKDFQTNFCNIYSTISKKIFSRLHIFFTSF